MATGSIKKISVGRKDLFLLHPDSIHEEDGWNVRTEDDNLKNHIRCLANSIKEIGVQQPLTVYMRGNEAVLTDGHCRLMAVRLAISEGADIQSIPVRTEERYSNDADRVLSMLTRNSGRQLTMLEQAEVVRRLLAFNWSESDIANKTGHSRQHINNLVCLLSSPSEIQAMVKSGQISASNAVAQVRKEGGSAAETLKIAIDTAKGEGKKKATSRHIKKKKIDLVRPIEIFAGKLPENNLDKMERILELCAELRDLIK